MPDRAHPDAVTDELVERMAVALCEYDGYDWAQIAEAPRHGNDERWCRRDYRQRARAAAAALNTDDGDGVRSRVSGLELMDAAVSLAPRMHAQLRATSTDAADFALPVWVDGQRRCASACRSATRSTPPT